MAHKLFTNEVRTRVGNSKNWRLACELRFEGSGSWCFDCRESGFEIDVAFCDDGNVSASVFALGDDEQEPISCVERKVCTEAQLGTVISEAVKNAVKSPMLKHRLLEV